VPQGIDQQEFDQMIEMQERIGSAWPIGTTEVLATRNPQLLRELDLAKETMNSFLLIPDKPKALKRQLKSAFEKYEQVALDCITYASRHLKLGEQGEMKSEG